ncbi:hypothetical protein Q7P37_011001 [Cladosporium fusiforme]
MSKRGAGEAGLDGDHLTKRIRPSSTDHLSRLSDELVLRVLSYLPVSQLVLCQRLSHKYRVLAGDGHLWKQHYYDRFVRPRASRLPGLKDVEALQKSLHFASKASKWLDDEHLIKRGGRTNWKRQYKLRHNWTSGSCAVNEIQVAEQAPVPPVIVQMHDGVIYMADQSDGLRAWSAKSNGKMLAQRHFDAKDNSPPTSLAVDAKSLGNDLARVVVGFENGSFSIFALDHALGTFSHCYSHEPSTNGVLSSAAIAWPYVVTMTATQLLSLYKCESATSSSNGLSRPPQLLHSLKSHTVWPPLTTSLRIAAGAVVVSVAYAIPTYLSGWTVGVQEVKLSEAGNLLESRTSSAIDQHYRPLAFASHPTTPHLTPASGGLATSTTLELRHIHSKPTSLSYTHPYLLVSHPDNTLTLYLVSSTAESLSISAGSRLWGHTSSVSGAHVGGRGKAVSVSKRGDELRVWELEGGFSSLAARKRLAVGDLSVRLQPETKNDERSEAAQAGLDLVNREDGGAKATDQSLQEDKTDEEDELTLTRGWIGFDEENVVVLKEQSQGRQADDDDDDEDGDTAYGLPGCSASQFSGLSCVSPGRMQAVVCGWTQPGPTGYSEHMAESGIAIACRDTTCDNILRAQDLWLAANQFIWLTANKADTHLEDNPGWPGKVWNGSGILHEPHAQSPAVGCEFPRPFSDDLLLNASPKPASDITTTFHELYLTTTHHITSFTPPRTPLITMEYNTGAPTGGRACYNCGDPSHQARDCPSKGTPTCYNCGNQGHLSRECTEPAKEKTCYQCGETGHLSRECPTAPAGGARGGFGGAAGGQECYKCGKVGHIARNCREGGAGFGGGYGQQQYGGRGGFGGGFGGPQQGGQTCYSCGGFGHMSRDCTQGQKCYNCGETGHLSRDCPSEITQERVCYRCKQPGHVQAACPQ